MVSDSPSVTILDLPLFLREDIYDYVFRDTHIDVRAYTDQVKHVNRTDSDWRWHTAYPNRTVPCPTLAIAQTCRLMRPEALVRFYRLAAFHFPGFSGVVAQLAKLSEIPSNDVEETITKGIPTRKSEGEEEEPALRIALDTQRETMKDMQRLIDDFCEVPCTFVDMKLWTWDASLHDYFPNLKELRLNIDVLCCRCDYKSLAKQYGIVPDDDHQRQQAGQQLELTDGQFLRKLVLNMPTTLRIWFEIDIIDTCTANGSTTIELDPSSEPKVKMKDWFNYYSCNDYLVDLLHDYGIHDEADKMQRMIDDGAPDLSVTWYTSAAR